MRNLSTAILLNNELDTLLGTVEGGLCPVQISGLSAVHRAQLAAALRISSGRPVVCVAPDETAADISGLVKAKKQEDSAWHAKFTNLPTHGYDDGDNSFFPYTYVIKEETVPAGYTVSYSELAALAGYPAAVRAVASAVGANALNLFIPCHRVLPADGSLGNYAGLPYCKYRLLRLEGVDIEYHRRIPY